ncbi:hypothetical protein BH23ACT9_BH23ACT9_22470 [soil metagenome]
MTRLRFAALTVLLVLVIALPAAAHTEIATTSPEMDSTVTDPPVELVIEFAGDLEAGSPVDVRALDPAGDDLVAGEADIDGRVVTVPLNQAVVPGLIEVDVAFTADDGDDQIESFSFTFDPPAGIASPTEDLTGPPVDPAPTATAEAAPVATPTSTPAPSPTPTPTETATEEEDLISVGDGGVGVLPVVLVVAVAAAAAGVLVLMLRRRDVTAADFTDPDEQR